MLSLYKKSFLGPITNPKNETLTDLTKQELTALLPLVALVAILGIYPKPMLDPIDGSVKTMLVNMEKKAVTQEAKDMFAKANTIGKDK